MAYITAGDPDLATTRKLVPELERRGVDILELGVPFSDPLADGPEIQRASQRALRHRVSIGDVLDLVADLRRETEIPIVLFTYFNPMHRFGLKRLVDRAAEAGVDGILALDLPPEEAAEYKCLMSEQGLDTIFLIAPTSREDRIQRDYGAYQRVCVLRVTHGRNGGTEKPGGDTWRQGGDHPSPHVATGCGGIRYFDARTYQGGCSLCGCSRRWQRDRAANCGAAGRPGSRFTHRGICGKNSCNR